MQNYIEPPQEIIDLIGVDKKLTNSLFHTHPVVPNNQERFMGAICYPKYYKISPELFEKINLEYNRIKAEYLKKANTPNLLSLVKMGSDYEPRFHDDIGNHRIRTEILNPKGQKFFIEVEKGQGEKMFIAHVVDRDTEEFYNKKLEEYHQKISNAGGYFVHHKGTYLGSQLEKYKEQPYYYYKKELWWGKTIKHTKTNLVELVNNLFECNFNKIELLDGYLTTNDYKSRSI